MDAQGSHDPFGYMQYQYQGDYACADAAAVEPEAHTPQASSPSDDAGTPKAPLLPFEGRPGRVCPGAPRKGKAPISYFDHLSGEAPVRRLSFSAAASETHTDGMASDSMEEDTQDEEEEIQHQQQQQLVSPQQQQQQQPQHHQMMQQPWQLPPLPQQQQQQQQQQLPPRQLFAQSPMQQRSPLLRSPQQLFVVMQQPLQQQPQQQQPQQQLWQPMSPTGTRPPSNQGGLTPARLFR